MHDLHQATMMSAKTVAEKTLADDAAEIRQFLSAVFPVMVHGRKEDTHL